MSRPKKNGNGLIKAENTALAYLKNYKGESGVDGISTEDMPQPRIKVRHAMSKLSREEKENIAEGDFYNTITKESYGNKIEVFPIFFWKSLVWFDKETQTLQAARHFYRINNTEEIQDIGEMKDQIDSDPEFKKQGGESYNFILAFADQIKEMSLKGSGAIIDPLIYSTRSASNTQVRKVFNPTVKMNWVRHGIPLAVHKIAISTIETQYEKGSAWIPHFDFIGYADDKEFAALMFLADQAKNTISKTAEQIKEVFD